MIFTSVQPAATTSSDVPRALFGKFFDLADAGVDTVQTARNEFS
jgi:hypothetical protein